MVRSCLSIGMMAALLPCFAGTPEDFFRAIRADESEAIKQLLDSGANVNLADGRRTTPLHYAAAFGSLESIKLLLAAKADVKAANAMGATPLILAASSPEKVKLLVAAGSDPNARTKAGRTALIIAAGRANATGAVRALLEAGADLNQPDERGITPLNAAASYGDLETVRLLISRGAKVDAADKAGATPLLGAAFMPDVERIKLLLAKGADVNVTNSFSGQVKHGPVALVKLTPLILAATNGSVDLVRVLLDAGAKVNVQDGRGMTPLMAAVSAEHQEIRIIKALLAAGADPNTKDTYGETALDWARKAGNPSIIRVLETAGAKGKALEPVMQAAVAKTVTPREATEQALALLIRSSKEFFKESGCIGCHHQVVTARAVNVAQASGFRAMPEAKEQIEQSMNAIRPVEPALLQFMDPGGEVDTVASSLIAFGSVGIPANSLTDAGLAYIAGKQQRDGSWTMLGISRAPSEDSDITRTALAVRALRLYSWPARQREFEERITHARAWLLKAQPRSNCERSDLLLGLKWAGASSAEIARAAATLRRNQRSDGGWAQNHFLASDPFATASAMHALHQTGQLHAADPAYQRGVSFLLRTRLEDGSWHVRSRAPKFQPYFQSGFPHDHDQWISAVATAFAAMALAPAMETPVAAARR